MEVLLPEYGGVQDLLDPLTVQPGLPAAPDRGHVIRDLRHPVIVRPGLLLAWRLTVVLDLQVLRGVRAGGGEDTGVYFNLTERQPVTPEIIPVRIIAANCGPSRVIWQILGQIITRAGPVFENISGGVAGITVGVDVVQGSEVADRQ